jgi:hypothetical protein
MHTHTHTHTHMHTHTHTHMHMHTHTHTHTHTRTHTHCTCTAQRTAHALHIAGTLLLTCDGGPPNPGDVFSLGAAAASALYIVRLSALSAGHDAAHLSAATLALSGAACTGITIAQAAAAGNLLGLIHQVAHALHMHGTCTPYARHVHCTTRHMHCMCATYIHYLAH